ncbi:hypothetical protein [Kitasatospora sp. NPDC089509]|uniref:hypothetical protein n=1 Tax=Kitasatospora sp. NPDC089509 TaxID=3364079 RepID=UPI003800B025
MPDFLIDYETLYQLGTKAGELKKSVDDAQAHETGLKYTEDQLGSWTTPDVLRDFYDAWKYAFQQARDVLGSVEGTFTSVAKALYDQDAALASGAAAQAAQFDYGNYLSKVHAYQVWERMSQTYVTMHYWDDQKKQLVETKVALADAKDKPALPGPPPKDFAYTNPDGSTRNTSFTYGDDNQIKGVSTDITSKDGLKYHENTSFTGDGGYKTDVAHADGKSTHVELTVSPDGSTGTKTFTDEDGKKIEYQGDMKTDQSQWTKTLDQKQKEQNDQANAQNMNNNMYV